MSFANRDSFTSFLIWMLLISFSFPIPLVRTSITMLDKSVKNGHSCLIPNLKDKASSFLPLSMKVDVGFFYMAFHYF